MVRQNMRINPAHKHMHTYTDFSGGINCVDVDERISDNEMVVLENVDIGERGSLRRRKGFEEYFESGSQTRWTWFAGKNWSDL